MKKSLTVAAAAAGLAIYAAPAAACDPVPGLLIGGTIGAFAGGPPGAAVGAFIGGAITGSAPCYAYAGPPPRPIPYSSAPPMYPSETGYAGPTQGYYPQAQRGYYAPPAPRYYAAAPAYYHPPPAYYYPRRAYYGPAAYPYPAPRPYYRYY